MTFSQWVGSGLLALIFIYIAARLVFAAYFRSKQQYYKPTKDNSHG